MTLKKLEKVLSEETGVSIGVIIVIIGAVISVARVSFVAESNATSIEEIKKDQTQYNKDVAETRYNIRLIKMKLNIKE